MTEANIAFVARLLADPTRAAMCLALAGGEARPAGELAARAGVSAQTASNHLAKLIDGRILRVEQQGRWRYYRLAGPDVGHAVEALAVVAPPLLDPLAGDGLHGAARGLKDARTCYSHLAGRLGVALADALVAGRWIEEDGRSYRLTPTGTRSLRALGIDVRRSPGAARRRGGAWTGRSAGRTSPARWARRSPPSRSTVAGYGACGGRGRSPSRRRGARSSRRCSTCDGRRGRHDHAEHPLHHRRAEARRTSSSTRGPWAASSRAAAATLVGYWLPTKFAGPTNAALALIDFPSLAAYEQYRERLAKDGDNVDCVRRAEESGCILVEDRAILERV